MKSVENWVFSARKRLCCALLSSLCTTTRSKGVTSGALPRSLGIQKHLSIIQAWLGALRTSQPLRDPTSVGGLGRWVYYCTSSCVPHWTLNNNARTSASMQAQQSHTSTHTQAHTHTNTHTHTHTLTHTHTHTNKQTNTYTHTLSTYARRARPQSSTSVPHPSQAVLYHLVRWAFSQTCAEVLAYACMLDRSCATCDSHMLKHNLSVNSFR